MSTTNWRSLCRLCAQNDGNELKVETIQNISRIVQKYFRITILTRDDCLLVACHECLHQLQNLDKFAARCVQVNNMFLELFNDSVSCDIAVPLRSNCEQNQLNAPQSLEIDDSGAEYLEIEYIQEFLQPEYEMKSEETYIDGNISFDNDGNMNKLGDMENSYVGNDIIYEEVGSNVFTNEEEVANYNICENDDENDVNYKEEDTNITYEEVDANDIIYEEMDSNNIIYEEENESEVNYGEKNATVVNYIEDDSKEVNYEEDVPFSAEELDNIEKLDDLIDVKNKKVPKKRFRLKINFTCDICDMKFSRPKPYTYHMKTKHSQDIGPVEYACDQCPKRFAYPSRLRTHQNEHLPEEQKRIHQCTQCETKFIERKNLIQHIKYIHDKDLPVICEECGKLFRCVTALNVHKIVHATARPCQCPKCPKTFKDPWHLKLHIEVHNDAIFECACCGKRMKTKRAVREHMVMHIDEKKFKCTYCDLLFKRKYTLKRHMVFHSGVRPFSCSFCDKTYTQASRVSYHERMYHTKLYNLRESQKAAQKKD